jgi:hypothetical protein
MLQSWVLRQAVLLLLLLLLVPLRPRLTSAVICPGSR